MLISFKFEGILSYSYMLETVGVFLAGDMFDFFLICGAESVVSIL
jgi:hypothetical protein